MAGAHDSHSRTSAPLASVYAYATYSAWRFR
jgi:hypothetical protein